MKIQHYSPNAFGHLIPDQDGKWMRVSDHQAIMKVKDAEIVINTRTAAEIVAACAKECAETEVMQKDGDYYMEDDGALTLQLAVQRIRALSPLSTDSKSTLKRLDIQREEK